PSARRWGSPWPPPIEPKGGRSLDCTATNGPGKGPLHREPLMSRFFFSLHGLRRLSLRTREGSLSFPSSHNGAGLRTDRLEPVPAPPHSPLRAASAGTPSGLSRVGPFHHPSSGAFPCGSEDCEPAVTPSRGAVARPRRGGPRSSARAKSSAWKAGS